MAGVRYSSFLRRRGGVRVLGVHAAEQASRRWRAGNYLRVAVGGATRQFGLCAAVNGSRRPCPGYALGPPGCYFCETTVQRKLRRDFA